MPRRNGNKRNGNGRVKVSTSPKGPSMKPTRVFRRTFRSSATVQLDNNTDDVAFKSGNIAFNPKTLLTGEEFFLTARCFEMYAVRRARVFIQPCFASYSPTSSLSLTSAAASTIWTVSDYTANETVIGNSDIKNYQNASFKTLSLNSLKKIIDTPVRMYRESSGSLSAGVMPASYWVDTESQVAGSFSRAQYLIELPGYDNIAINYRPKYRFIYELDIEFKQPGVSKQAASFAVNNFLQKVMKLGTYPSLDPPVTGGFTSYTCVGYKSQDIAGTQTLTFRFENPAATPSVYNITAPDFRAALQSGTYAGMSIQWDGPTLPSDI